MRLTEDRSLRLLGYTRLAPGVDTPPSSLHPLCIAKFCSGGTLVIVPFVDRPLFPTPVMQITTFDQPFNDMHIISHYNIYKIVCVLQIKDVL